MAPGRYFAPLIAAATLAMLCASSASATIFSWNWTPADGGASGLSSLGGSINSVHATYNDADKRLGFSVGFNDRITEGFYLILTDGEAPVGKSGKYGVFYFDAYDVFDADASTSIELTSYAYNGRNNHSSWRDGNPVQFGDQAPDCIKNASQSATWLHDAFAADTVLPGNIPGRLMGFDINASDLLIHTPMYPDSDAWKGTGFGDLLGIKFVPAQVYETDYLADGEIEWLGTENEGGFTGTFSTVRVPSPSGSLALVGAGLLISLRRARR